mgnify:CR=1 FL=1
MEKVSEYLRCKTELGIEKSTSIKNLDIAEVTSGIIDPTPPNNGFSISFTEELANSSCKDGLLISDSESGLDLPGYHSPCISLGPCLDKESMMLTLMITSTSLTERIG